MKTIVLNVDDLKQRAARLRSLKAEYEDCEKKLNQIMASLETVYKEDGQAVIDESLNMATSMQMMSEKLENLAKLLDYRAEVIEHAANE